MEIVSEACELLIRFRHVNVDMRPDMTGKIRLSRLEMRKCWKRPHISQQSTRSHDLNFHRLHGEQHFSLYHSLSREIYHLEHRSNIFTFLIRIINVNDIIENNFDLEDLLILSWSHLNAFCVLIPIFRCYVFILANHVNVYFSALQFPLNYRLICHYIYILFHLSLDCKNH